MLDLNRSAFQIIGVDLSEYGTFRGAVLDLDGTILVREERDRRRRHRMRSRPSSSSPSSKPLIARATLPLLGIGVGSPGVVDLGGMVLSAPNLGWTDEPLQTTLADRFGVPVVVGNDANAAALAEHSFGGAESDMMLVKVGHGVGAGLLLDGVPLFGSRFAAGEIGHVVVGTDGGPACACGKHGCLETWLAAPAPGRARSQPNPADRDAILTQAGERLGIALAPVVGALNLVEVVLSGPAHLLDGPLAEATIDTLRNRTMAEFHGDLTLRMTTARRGHRHARRSRHGALRATRGLLTPPCTSGVATRHPVPPEERKTHMKRKIGIVAAATAALLVLAGCSSHRRRPPTRAGPEHHALADGR